MRIFLGLAALAAVNAQTVTLSGSFTGNSPGTPQVGTAPTAAVYVYQTQNQGVVPTVSPAGFTNTGSQLPSNNYAVYVPNSVNTVVFVLQTNSLVAQLQHRWAPGYTSPASLYPGYNLTPLSYTCDLCTGTPSAINCNTATGPGSSPSPLNGYPCASLTRIYTFSGLQASITTANPKINSIAFQLFDINQNPAPNTSSYSFTVVRAPATIVGDPQIVGLQGQDFQVHGMPDEIFNMITYPTLQVNARFVYLSSGECIDNFTGCFAHPGTYISEEGIRLGNDKVHVRAGSAKKGLTVSINGKKAAKHTTLKLGSVQLVNHRRVVIKTPILNIQISNSDKFLNQETELVDSTLLTLGAERRVLADGESFHSDVPLHGLQGQTWRNVEYPSGLEYEGSISDYHVTDGNLYGSSFVFNQFKH